VVTHHPT
jgi:hypothetical protein